MNVSSVASVAAIVNLSPDAAFHYKIYLNLILIYFLAEVYAYLYRYYYLNSKIVLGYSKIKAFVWF